MPAARSFWPLMRGVRRIGDITLNLDFSKVIPVSEMSGESEEETEDLRKYLREAEEEINFYTWHNGIVNSYFGMGVGGIFAVFLFEIIPNREDVDKFVWVIVGDLPSAYITCEEAPNPDFAASTHSSIAPM